LLGDLLVEDIDARLRRRNIGGRLVQRGLIVARVYPCQVLAGLHRLVVASSVDTKKRPVLQ
jgi:hypothetical protein